MMFSSLLKSLVITLASISSAPAIPAETAPDAQQLLAGLPPEVRLRKLHLVRPDLIPFPICYDVYC